MKPKLRTAASDETCCRFVDSCVLYLSGVKHAFAQVLVNGTTRLYIVAQDDASEADRATLRLEVQDAALKHALHHFNTLDVKVVKFTEFNEAIRAVLSRNFELEVEMKRIRELTPDIDAALRTLDQVRRDPENSLPLFPVDIAEAEWSQP